MEDDKIITLRQPGEVADPLTEVLRNGARALPARTNGALLCLNFPRTTLREGGNLRVEY